MLVLALLACAACGPMGRQPVPPPVQTPAPRPPVSSPAQPAAPQAAATPVPSADSRVVLERANGALLRPGVARYQLTLSRAGQTIPLGTRTVEVAEATIGGTAGWLLAETRAGSAVPTSDSLWLTRATLAPVRWAAAIGAARMAASFTQDSVFGAVQTYQGRSSFVTPLPAAALLTDGMVDRLVEMLPLRLGYRSAASLLRLEFGARRSVPAELVVERDERVRVGGAEVDCWVVALRAGALEERRWVTKGDARVVRTVQALPDGVLVGERVP
jgi:hypothetical protein